MEVTPAWLLENASVEGEEAAMSTEERSVTTRVRPVAHRTSAAPRQRRPPAWTQASEEGVGWSVRQGDEEAFHEAYRRYSTQLTRLVFNATRSIDAAADVVQEVFECLWRHPERFDPHRGALRSYLTVSARSAAIDWMRREEARRRREGAVDVTTVCHGADHSDDRATVTTVRAALESLPERELIPILLAYWTELTYREVADVVGVPEGTVKSRIRSGFRRLAALTAVRVPPDPTAGGGGAVSGQSAQAAGHER